MRTIIIGGDTRAVLGSFTPEPVSLATLKASKIAIEWHEAVAIVQQVARGLLEASASQSGSELSGANVKIDQTGTVLVPRDGVQDGPSAVSQLATLLRDLLPDTLPVPLRLAISQALSNPPHYTSITSFSDALSYFERPDSTGIIRAVYERWEATAGGKHTASSREEPVTEHRPAAEEPVPQGPRTQTANAMLRLILVFLGVGGAAALALFILATVWGVRFTESGADDPAESAPSADRSAMDAAPAPASAEIASAGTTRTAALLPAVTAPSRVERALTPALVRNAQPEPEPVLSNPDASVQSLAAAAGVAVPMETLRREPPAVPAARETPVSITIVEPAPAAHIYSALDTEVAAPVAASKQSPVVATVFHDDEMLTFDVVIDQTGKVESVKLLHAPTSIRSTLMLTMSMSVAKAWRFMPATRHGQSVRYRQSFSVPVSQ